MSAGEVENTPCLLGSEGGEWKPNPTITALVSMLSQMNEASVVSATEMLCLLSMNDDARRAIGMAEAIPSLIHVMRNYDNEVLSMNILNCLLNLAHQRDNRATLRDPEFYNVLLATESAGDFLVAAVVGRLRRTIGGSFLPHNKTEEHQSLHQPW